VGGGVITYIWMVVSVVGAVTPAAATPSPAPSAALALAFAVTAGSVAVGVFVTGEAIGPVDGASVVVVWPSASKDIVGGEVVGVAPDSDEAARGLQPAAASSATAPSAQPARRARPFIGATVPGRRRAPGGGDG
jgi:hypothetical protein